MDRLGSLLGSLAFGTGAFLLILAGMVALAYAHQSAVLIPGVFTGWFTRENGSLAFEFQPNGMGIVLVIVVIAVLHFSMLTLRRCYQR